MRRLFIHSLAIALLLPSVALANIDFIHPPGSDTVPAGDCVYSLCADAAAAGYLPNHTEAEFSGTTELTELEFARFTVEVFEVAQQARADLAKLEKPNSPYGYYYLDKDETDTQREAYEALEQRADTLKGLSQILYFRFADLLTPTNVTLNISSPSYDLHFAIDDATEPARARRRELAKEHPDDYVARSAYDDLPTDHWAYSMLDQLCRDGVLEGYPEGFFNGSRLLTRYEFAQAVARLLDTVYMGSEVRRKAFCLGVEFNDQLNEMCKQIDGFNGCNYPDPPQ